MATVAPGAVVLFGSGETTPSGRKIFASLFQHLAQTSGEDGEGGSASRRVAVLETPAGFELNSSQVAGRVAGFIRHRLQNYHPEVSLVPARRRGTPHSPDEPAVVAPLFSAEVIFLGPGSPTYAVRQLRGSLAWHVLVARHRLGAGLALASAAAIAIGALALPVYEIYKVGEDIHWKEGLDFFGPYGLSLVFVPHWNNSDGGEELDTRRCFMGLARFAPLVALLPPEMVIVGIDEQSGLMIEPAFGRCRVIGKGGVTILRGGEERRFSSGQAFSMFELGEFRLPEPEAGVPEEIWRQALEVHRQARRDPQPPEQVLALLEERRAARERQEWGRADELREKIAGFGWQVVDTAEGSRLEKIGTSG